MLNLVEQLTDSEDMRMSPCRHGNIVEGHACYCHNDAKDAPRKCPIWRHYGESDLSKWHSGGDFDRRGWDGGCKWFVPFNAVANSAGACASPATERSES